MDSFKHFLKNLAPITDKEFEDSLTYFTEQKLKKDDFFVRQGMVCRHIAFILGGTLRAYYLNDKATETISCFCTAGNFTTAFKSFMLQEPSHSTIQALEPTHLLVIEYSNLQRLYNQIPTWQIIGRKVAEREFIVLEHYASVLNNETAKEKYARLLKEQPEIIQKANVEDIASYLGVTRRTLSRIRKVLSLEI